MRPHEEWHIDWAIMGQETLGLDGEGYTLAVCYGAKPRQRCVTDVMA